MPRTVKLCPCGSGKSLKHAAGTVKLSFPGTGQVEKGGPVLGAALDCTLTSLHLPGMRPGPDLYLGCLDQQLVDREDDFTIERCFEWFIFDYKLCVVRPLWKHSGKRILQS